MTNGQRVLITLPNEGVNYGHAVVMKSIVQQTITKYRGNVTTNTFYNVMNPANGGYIMRLTTDRINNASFLYYIF
jgi:hypothetical protein